MVFVSLCVRVIVTIVCSIAAAVAGSVVDALRSRWWWWWWWCWWWWWWSWRLGLLLMIKDINLKEYYWCGFRCKKRFPGTLARARSVLVNCAAGLKGTKCIFILRAQCFLDSALFYDLPKSLAPALNFHKKQGWWWEFSGVMCLVLFKASATQDVPFAACTITTIN